MRVAIVVNSFPVVSETFIVNKVLGLRSAGVDVTVVAHMPSRDLALFSQQMSNFLPTTMQYGLLDKKKWQIPSRLIDLVARHPTQLRDLWQKTTSLYGVTKRSIRAFLMAAPLVVGGYAIIHFEYSGLAVAYLDVLPLLKQAKLVTSCRGAAEQITPLVDPHRGARLRQLFKLIDRVHCVSEDMFRTVQAYGVSSEQAFVNHPAIDVDCFQRTIPYALKSQGPYTLLSVGRLHWKKGFEYSLMAIRYLLDWGYDVCYHIIGKGIQEESLRYAIHDLGLHQHVHLHGSQNSLYVRQKLEEADLYLLPSISEGLSNAALEAMAMELPIVSTTAGGMEEAITDGSDGFLVSSRQPKEMAEKVALLLQTPDLRLKVGKVARDKIEAHFTLKRQIQCFVSEYQQLLKRG